MHRLLLIVLVLSWMSDITAQIVLDFTVTDYRKQVHQLYADYLDQGKSVVLELSFSTCPQCTEIASYAETLYRQWGAGKADVQFIELSILSSDRDEDMNLYKKATRTTYPACSAEGGSIPVVSSFISGQYGPYHGTPTFVVIAPDRSIHYNGKEATSEGTMIALNEAIETTGATGIIANIYNLDPELPVHLLSGLVGASLTLKAERAFDDLRVQIFDVTGKLVKEFSLPVTATGTSGLDMTFLPPGPWICMIREPETRKMVSYLFIKQ